MKRQCKNALLVASIAAATFSISSVNADSNGIYLSETFSYFHPTNDGELSDDTGGTFGLGYKFAKPLALELGYTIAAPRDFINQSEAIYRQARLDGLFFFNEERFRPYFAVGVGHSGLTLGTGKTTGSAVNAGLGFFYEVMPRLDIRGDIRFVDDNAADQAVSLTSLGIAYRFFDLGAKPVMPESTPAPAPVMTDSDNDGVLDRNDRCPNSAAGVEVDEFGCEVVKVVEPEPVVVAPKEVTIRLDVQFPTNSSIIPPAYISEVQAVAEFMRKYPDTTVVVEGHTDDTGSEAYNTWLSGRRAHSVEMMLIDTFGIAAKRVASKGYGESMPLVPNDSAANRATNRRVVAVINTFEK